MAGILRTDTIQNSNTSTIITQTNSTTITIGTTGQTVALASGASSSGFGATYNGAVNWDTTPKTSSPVTAVSGNGYFINTTSGAITVNLPSTPAAGDIVAIADYANTSATNNITVGRNGSKIDGNAIDGTISINGQVYTLVYVDSTEGWKTVGQTFNQITTASYVSATGGTITTCGDYKIHTFTGPGTFTVSSVGNPFGSTTVDYLVVAGGGGGGTVRGGGGGAGGYRESKATGAPWTASPLASSTSLPVSVTAYPITVGGGGTGGTSTGCAASRTNGTSGSNSIFSTITSAGGGRGSQPCQTNETGGSGGGGVFGPSPGAAANGNTPPVSPPQGNNSGTGAPGPGYGAGGGGGATAVGVNGSGQVGGNGGTGATTSISGSSLAYSGGGGGSFYQPGGTAGTGGSSIGGAGGTPGGTGGGAGTTNRGGGGGGGYHPGPGTQEGGGNGGSGIVVIRYKYQ